MTEASTTVVPPAETGEFLTIEVLRALPVGTHVVMPELDKELFGAACLPLPEHPTVYQRCTEESLFGQSHDFELDRIFSVWDATKVDEYGLVNDLRVLHFTNPKAGANVLKAVRLATQAEVDRAQRARLKNWLAANDAEQLKLVRSKTECLRLMHKLGMRDLVDGTRDGV